MRHNLLSESEQVRFGLKCFLICFVYKFRSFKTLKVLYMLFDLLFFANFNLQQYCKFVSDLTCFLLVIFSIGMDLHGSIMLSSGSFASKFWEMIKMQFYYVLV